MTTPRLLGTAYALLFILFILPKSAMAICLPTTVSTFSNQLETTVCPSDGEADLVKFKPNSWATAYRFIITDENDIIVDWFSGNKYDFENLGGGVSRVYGLSYSGVPDFPIGENIFLADFDAFCSILSSNFVVVNRVIPDGGNVITAGGDTVAYTCPDGNPDVLSFSNTNASIGNYAYLIANANDTIVGISDDGDFDFEGLPEGSCFVYGVAYAGDLTAQVGDNINTTDLSDSCFDLSDTAVEVFKDVPEGGTVALLDGSDFVEICVGDGQPSIVDYSHLNPSNSLYGYLITDENDDFLAFETNDFYDFANSSAGVCRIYGVAFTGNAQPSTGENIFNNPISDDCFSLSTNFITVQKQAANGGTVTTDSGESVLYLCPDDGVEDVVNFVTINSGSVNYAYVITDTLGNILGFEPNDFHDFDGAGEGVCYVYGLSYFESFNSDATNIFTDVLADDCYELSDNFIEIIRETPNAGDILFLNGDTVAYTCPGDGNADVLAFTISNNSNSKIAYVITNESDEVLGTTTTGNWDFDDAPAGNCRIYSIAYTGNFQLSTADSLFLTLISDDCFSISDDYLEVIRATPSGGLIALDNGATEIYTCPGNGSADIVEFIKTDASNSLYAYLILDENNLVLDIELGDSHDFEDAPLGNCFVLGVAYTGNITLQIGDDAATVDFSDDCFAFSDNLITIRRVNPEAGTVAFANGNPATSICSGDGNPDVISVQNVDASNAPFQFIITDSSDVILGNSFAFNINFDLYGSIACRIYGLSYTGDYAGTVGDTLQNIDLSTDCYDLSTNFLTIAKNYVNAGNLTTTDGEQSIVVCPGDGNPNVIEFTNDSDAEVAIYQYIVTNNQGVILSLPTSNSFDFEPAGVGICKVYGVSYTGNLTAEIDSSITTVFSDECYVVSDNFIEIIRDQPDGDIIVSDLGSEIDFCVNDGNPHVVNFITGSFSFANYAYLITDENGFVITTEMNDFYDFYFLSQGVYLVYGISYTGHLIAGEGDNIQTDPLSDDCFDLSDNFITINRILVDGATIFTPSNATEIYTCPGDGNADFVGLFNTSTVNADYRYVITSDSNSVIDIVNGNLYNFENLPEGTCRIYGFSYTGAIEVDTGDNLFTTALTDGCYDVSDNFITVIKVNPVGGNVSTIDGVTDTTIIVNGVTDTLYFVNTSSPLAKQRYVITDENEVILNITEDDFVDFENAGLGVCKVYSLVYTGNLLAFAGDIFLENDPATGCWAVSDNFVTVTRIDQSPNLNNGGGLPNFVNEVAQLEIYPNPASDYINITIAAEIENQGQIQIVDLAGKIVLTRKYNFAVGQNSIEIPIRNWEEGLYLMTIQNGELFFYVKFVKD